jgi:hypothetical protein
MQPTRSPNRPSGTQRIVALFRARTRPGTVRRLAILAEDGTLAPIGRSSELLVVIERHSDQALTFVWRSKGALTVTTVLGTFLGDAHAFPQCLLAGCLPQRVHDRQPCARRCRRTEARKTCVGSLSDEVRTTDSGERYALYEPHLDGRGTIAPSRSLGIEEAPPAQERRPEGREGLKR